jgi:hypothetical protein
MTNFAARCAAALTLLAAAMLLSACQTDSPGSPSAQAAPQEQPAKPMTHQEAALQCWMSVEKTHKDLALDKRADVVTKCIDDKMSGKVPPPAAEAKPEPKPKTPKSKT